MVTHGNVVLSARGLRSGRLLKEASFDIRRGEIVGLSGLVGAGRTNVARVLFGADPADGGQILIDGKPVSIRSPRDAVRYGIGLELDAIAAAVLGGASLSGGVGGIGGTVAGAFIIGVLSNGLNLLAVPSYNQQVLKGLVFILAVLLDYLLKQRWQLRITPKDSADSTAAHPG